MQNRKLWINAVINALQCELEVIRVENLDTRTGTPEGELQDQLNRVLDQFDERIKKRPLVAG